MLYATLAFVFVSVSDAQYEHYSHTIARKNGAPCGKYFWLEPEASCKCGGNKCEYDYPKLNRCIEDKGECKRENLSGLNRGAICKALECKTLGDNYDGGCLWNTLQSGKKTSPYCKCKDGWFGKLDCNFKVCKNNTGCSEGFLCHQWMPKFDWWAQLEPQEKCDEGTCTCRPAQGSSLKEVFPHVQ